MKKSPSFTLIEILIVLALISILAGILILTIKPQEIFKRARDSKRISDLKNLEKALDSIYASTSTFSELTYASPNTVYISLPDNNPNCSSWLSELPSLPSGWSYRCSATPTNIDGTGWIPIPFSNFPILNISQLFIDPINKPPYYYSFVAGGSYAVYAELENPKHPASKNDGDNYPHLFSVGTNKRLIDQAQGLVGYWPFDEGSGTIAYDYSGNGNNGTLCNGSTCGVQGPTWTTGKVGGALSFDGVDDYVNVGNNAILQVSTDITVVAWVKFPTVSAVGIAVGKYGNSGESGWILLHTSAGNFKFDGRDGSGSYRSSGPSQEIDDNQWHHVGGQRKGSIWKIFVDGVQANSNNVVTSGSIAAALDNVYIGRYSLPGYIFNGLIDDVRIYNRALSDAEIKALYDATK